MDSAKYIGMDVHKESISIAVLNSAGKAVSWLNCCAATSSRRLQGTAPRASKTQAGGGTTPYAWTESEDVDQADPKPAAYPQVSPIGG